MNPDVLLLDLPEGRVPLNPPPPLPPQDWNRWLHAEYARLVRVGRIVPGTEPFPVNFQAFEIPQGVYGNDLSIRNPAT